VTVESASIPAGRICRPLTGCAAAVAIVSLAIAPPLLGQSRHEQGQMASFAAGGSFGDGDTALALSAGLAFRLSHRLRMDVELAHARKLDFTLDLCPPPRLCVLGGQVPVTGRTVSLVPHLVVDLLPESRLGAYVQFGIGAGHVRQRYFSGLPFTGGPSGRVELTRSSLTIAVSFGGGATVQVSPRLGVGIDVRSLHLRDDPASIERFIVPSGTLSTLRVGSRVSWRF
jgi:hypothetical protein